MIAGIFHQGSGLGNQLHRLVATRVRALDLGVDWGMIYNHDGSGKEEGFKGKSFMDIGEWNKQPYALSEWQEKKVTENNIDTRSYDPEFNFVEDGTIIDGEFQDERYWEHREPEVSTWLTVEPLVMPDDVCVIGFRGGEYALYPDLFLTKDYYDDAMARMKQINPNMRFEVHTDDIYTATQFFGKNLNSHIQTEFRPDHHDYYVYQDIGMNWRSMRYAKYAIIANSSFFILPRWLRQGKNDGAVTICPRFWARRNIKVWALPQNYYKRFTHI